MRKIRGIFAVLIVTISSMMLCLTIQAQSIYKLANSKDVNLKLSGTSTLHNWTMESKTMAAEAQFTFQTGKDNTIQSLTSFTFSLPVLNLKSDKTGLDNNAYQSLKTDKYKEITYKIISATIVPQQKNKYLIKTIGNLTIAGTTKEIAIESNCQVNTDKTITCTGSQKIKMTDFKVKPPTFMLGAMSTGDEITIDFNLVLKESKGLTIK